jgi:hypothetical protein
MAFQKSLQQALADQMQYLAELEKKYDEILTKTQQKSYKTSKAMAQAFKKAAEQTSALAKHIHQLTPSEAALGFDSLAKSMDRIKNWTGFDKVKVSGKKASDTFKKAWKENVTGISASLDKVNKLHDSIERRTLALSKKRVPWDDAKEAYKAEQDAIAKIQNQMNLNKRLIAELTKMRANASAAEKQAIDERIKKLQTFNKALKETEDKTAGIGEKMKELQYQERVQKIEDKVTKPFRTVKDNIGPGYEVVKRLMKSPAFLIGGAVMMIMAIFKALLDGTRKVLLEFNEAGLTPRQWGVAFRQATTSLKTLAKEGILTLKPEEAAKAVAALETELGRVTLPQTLTDQVARMSEQINLPAEQGAKFLGTMYRIHGYNADRAEQVSKYVIGFARRNDINAKQLLSTMNQHFEDFASSAKMTAKSFATAAADANRIGISMSRWTGLADRLVGDFEGALVSQAKLATMFPGMNMDEVMFASQFGGVEDVQNAVKEMFQASNITSENFANMPRSFKMALKNELGMSASEIASILGDKDVSKYAEPDERDQIQFRENVAKVLLEGTGGLGQIIQILQNILMAITGGFIGKRLFGNPEAKNKEIQEQAQRIARTTPVDSATDLSDTAIAERIYKQKRPGGLWGPSKYVQTDEGIKAVIKGAGDVTISNEEIQAVRLAMAKKVDKSQQAEPSLATQTHHTGGIAGMYPRPLPNEVVAVLEKGEGILTEEMMGNLAKVISTTRTVATIAPKIVPLSAPVSVQPMYTPQKETTGDVRSTEINTASIDLTKLEDLLSQLVSLTREGKVIQVDGRKLGETIVASNVRHNG